MIRCKRCFYSSIISSKKSEHDHRSGLDELLAHDRASAYNLRAEHHLFLVPKSTGANGWTVRTWYLHVLATTSKTESNIFNVSFVQSTHCGVHPGVVTENSVYRTVRSSFGRRYLSGEYDHAPGFKTRLRKDHDLMLAHSASW